MFEAEIKYVAASADELPGGHLPEVVSRDVYFDSPDGVFYASGQELRLRTVDDRTLLTYKRPPFDAATASKEEVETVVADADAMPGILAALGFVPRVAFAKRCRRTREDFQGHVLEIAIVTVDFSPDVFVEIEHLAQTHAAALTALPVIRARAAGLGLTRECQDSYTDLALAAGPGGGPEPATEGAPRP